MTKSGLNAWEVLGTQLIGAKSDERSFTQQLRRVEK